MSETMHADYLASIETIADRYGRNPDFLIPMMQDVQTAFGYLPRDALEGLADLLGIPPSQCFSVATFYKSFSLVPRGRHTITVCLGTVCYLKGGREIAETIERELEVKAGGTSRDGLFTYEPVNCLGACALAPVVVVDSEYYDHVKLRDLPRILKKYREADRKGQ